MAIVLGFSPDDLTVKASRFGDFVAGLEVDYGDPTVPNVWPDAAVIEIHLFATDSSTEAAHTWEATIDGALALWHIPKSQVIEELLDPGNDVARLIYTDDDVGTLEWAVGITKDTG